MKEHNSLVKFKNSFLKNTTDQQKLSNIISDDIQTQVGNKMNDIFAIYKSNTAQHGYSINLAYRFIILFLMAPKETDVNIKEEISRFFKYCLQDSQIEKIRFAFDLLIIKEIYNVLSLEQVRLIKIKLLKAMKQYYSKANNRKDCKKCGYTLEQYCKSALKLPQIKRNNEIYCQILDILIELIKDKISSYIQKKKQVNAVEKLTNFVTIIQKNEFIITKKYQLELMEAYLSLAILHHRLHYAAYSKKYANIALNIAERTQSGQRINVIKELLQKIG